MTKTPKHKKTTSAPQQPKSESKNKKKKKWFGKDVRWHTKASPNVPNFDRDLRDVMEPHLAKARKNREDQRMELPAITDSNVTNCITSSRSGVPYLALRTERSFSFCEEAHPLHRVLAETLGVTNDLSLLHEEESLEGDKGKLMRPLLHRATRQPFHECYDTFVTSFCVPYLHRLAMNQNLFQNVTTATDLTYRYQAFPCLRIVRPGEFSIGPHCDVVYGHSVGNINFHVPLTPVYGTNALYTERYPGREDWHPLTAENVGIGYIFDGARCLHFSLENTTDATRVSLDFRIAISLGCGGDHDDGQECNDDDENDTFCSAKVLHDRFEESGPGYYDNVIVRIGCDTPESEISNNDSFVVKLDPDRRLLDPDKRVGFPFK